MSTRPPQPSSDQAALASQAGADGEAAAPEPPLVRRALDLAERTGFAHSSAPEVGRLLRVLAASVRSGSVGEIGTGCGVGAAWILSELDPTTHFVTIDIEAERVAQARALFADHPNVEVLCGDWREILPHGPFDLLFADGGKAKENEPELVLSAVKPGGLVLLDDLTPEELWPAEWRGREDPVRKFWLNDPRVAATELLVTPRTAVILAVRRLDGRL